MVEYDVRTEGAMRDTRKCKAATASEDSAYVIIGASWPTHLPPLARVRTTPIHPASEGHVCFNGQTADQVAAQAAEGYEGDSEHVRQALREWVDSRFAEVRDQIETLSDGYLESLAATNGRSDD